MVMVVGMVVVQVVLVEGMLQGEEEIQVIVSSTENKVIMHLVMVVLVVLVVVMEVVREVVLVVVFIWVI